MHGAGGFSFDDILTGKDGLSGFEVYAKISEALTGAGTDCFLIGLITKPWDTMLETVRVAAKICSKSPIARGIYLEGPFISPAKKGAHNPEYLISPTASRIKELLDAGGGHLKMVTLAPELSGAPEAIETLEHAGVVAAIGHTAADYDLVTDMINNAGAHHFTHLFNAMEPINHRHPGPVIAALDAYNSGKNITVEVINDGVHLADPIVRWCFNNFSQANPKDGNIADVELETGVILVTDSMSAATLDDGFYMLGDLSVVVNNGKAVIEGTDTIAGSTLTLQRALERARGLGINESLIDQAVWGNPTQLIR